MLHRTTLALVAGLALCAGAALRSTPRAGRAASRATIDPPEPPREFRAAWVATVANIDWPRKRGLPVSEQKAEMIAILNRAKQLNLNAIILQVRPCCDAIYPSKLEPWTEYLTGTMGQPPKPHYDPLEDWITEAHNRGIELHAWFNPFRAHHPSQASPICSEHVSCSHPAIVRSYGRHLWLDPGEKETQDYSLRVIMDVVNRYDVDGVHLDDYFYPYREKDASGHVIDFPDGPAWRRYRAAGGELTRDDWRRQNVDQFVERLYHDVKEAKPWVKVGISPFGIWRPHHPSQIRGFDPYEQIYADSKRWLNEGWVDYFAPQLYWSVSAQAQSFPALLRWWAEQNTHHRNLWPGSYTSRVHEGAWRSSEILQQIARTRAQPGASGNIHFSMEAIMSDADGLNERLLAGPYAEPALVPASPWLDSSRPRRPDLEARPEGDGLMVSWVAGGSHRAHQWLLQVRTADGWRSHILPGDQSSASLRGPAVDAVALRAVDRCGVASEPVTWHGRG